MVAEPLKYLLSHAVNSGWNTIWIAWYPFTCSLETQEHTLTNGRWDLKDKFFSHYSLRSKSSDTMFYNLRRWLHEMETLAILDTKQWSTPRDTVFVFLSLRPASVSLHLSLFLHHSCIPGIAFSNYIITHRLCLRLYFVRTPRKFTRERVL